jgi:hypothetical protein
LPKTGRVLHKTVNPLLINNDLPGYNKLVVPALAMLLFLFYENRKNGILIFSSCKKGLKKSRPT